MVNKQHRARDQGGGGGEEGKEGDFVALLALARHTLPINAPCIVAQPTMCW